MSECVEIDGVSIGRNLIKWSEGKFFGARDFANFELEIANFFDVLVGRFSIRYYDGGEDIFAVCGPEISGEDGGAIEECDFVLVAENGLGIDREREFEFDYVTFLPLATDFVK